MSKKEKLVARIKKLPSDFHYREVERLLLDFGYEELKIGKTSGSRVKFVNSLGDQIRFHKPHPTGIMKIYQLKELIEKLGI